MTWKRTEIRFEGASAPFITITATEEERKPRTIETGYTMTVETSWHLSRVAAEENLHTMNQ